MALSLSLCSENKTEGTLAANRLKLLNGGLTGASTVNRRTLFRSRAQAGWEKRASPFRIQGREPPFIRELQNYRRRGNSRFESRPRFSELSANSDTNAPTTIHPSPPR